MGYKIHDTTELTHSHVEQSKHDEKHDANGFELGDPTPMEPPLGYRKAPTLTEQIQQQVRQLQLRMLEDQMSPETEEEADDFEVGDDYEPLSKYENEHMPTLANLKKRAKEINDQIEARKLKLAIDAQKDKIARAADRMKPPAEPEETSQESTSD